MANSNYSVCPSYKDCQAGSNARPPMATPTSRRGPLAHSTPVKDLEALAEDEYHELVDVGVLSKTNIRSLDVSPIGQGSGIALDRSRSRILSAVSLDAAAGGGQNDNCHCQGGAAGGGMDPEIQEALKRPAQFSAYDVDELEDSLSPRSNDFELRRIRIWQVIMHYLGDHETEESSHYNEQLHSFQEHRRNSTANGASRYVMGAASVMGGRSIARQDDESTLSYMDRLIARGEM